MSQKSAKKDRREADVPLFIVWARDYYDNRNRRVRERVIVHGDRPEGMTQFVAYGKVDVITKLGATVHPLTAPIPGATNVLEAFALFDETIVRAAEKANKKIVRPGPGNLPPFPGRNGP